MKGHYYFLFWTLLLTAGCKHQSTPFKNQIQLVNKGNFAITLDSVTPRSITSYFHNLEENELSIMNIYTNQVYNFDDSSGKLLSIDSYEVEGPNGVGDFSNVTEFVRFGDSTIIYDRVLKSLIITNDHQKVIFKKTFGKNKTRAPYGMWGDWLVRNENGFDLSGSAVSLSFLKIEPRHDSLEFEFNLESDELRPKYLPLPFEYADEKWLTEMLRYYRAYNTYSREMIYSWPISDSIFVKDPFGKVRSYLMSTNNIRKPIPLPNDIEKIVMNPSRKAVFMFEKGFYSNIYLDPFRDVVLRCAFSGIEEGMVDMSALFENPDHFDMTLIIANNKYEKLAEFDADEYNLNVVFFKEDGIYILKRSDDEDELLFDRFSIGPND